MPEMGQGTIPVFIKGERMSLRGSRSALFIGNKVKYDNNKRALEELRRAFIKEFRECIRRLERDHSSSDDQSVNKDLERIDMIKMELEKAGIPLKNPELHDWRRIVRLYR